MNGPNTINSLADREITLRLGEDGKLYPSGPVPDLLPALKDCRALAQEYAEGKYFPSVEAMLAEVAEGKNEYAYIDARYPRWIVVRAMAERRMFRTTKGVYGLFEF